MFEKQADRIAAKEPIIPEGNPSEDSKKNGMKKKRNRIPIIILACSILMGSTVGVTYSYLISNEKKANSTRITEANIKIVENFVAPTDPSPGDTITKSPKVTNNSKAPVKVRVQVKFTDSKAEQQCEPLVIGSNWTKNGEYYYYNQELAPGASTTPLFNYVTIRSTVAKKDLVPFDILVYAEAVQSFGDISNNVWS